MRAYHAYPTSPGLPMPDRYFESKDDYFKWCAKVQGKPVSGRQRKWLKHRCYDCNAHFTPFYRQEDQEEPKHDVEPLHYDLALSFIGLVTEYLADHGKLTKRMGRQLALLTAQIRRWRNQHWTGNIKDPEWSHDATSWPGNEALRAAMSDVWWASCRGDLVLTPATLSYLSRGYYKIDLLNAAEKSFKRWKRAYRGIRELIEGLHNCAKRSQAQGAGGDIVSVPLTSEEQARLIEHLIDGFGKAEADDRLFPRCVYRRDEKAGRWVFDRRMTKAEDAAYDRYLEERPPPDDVMTAEGLADYGKGFQAWWASQQEVGA